MTLENDAVRKVLFLSSGETIARMFTRVIRQLKPGDHEVLVLNQDWYYGENSAEILERNGATTRSLRDYGVYDVRAVLHRESPDVVVVGHAGGAVEMAFIASCRSMGIPTLLLQDGLMVPPSSLSLDDSFAMVFHMISSFLKNPRALLRYLFLINTLGPRNFARTLTSWSQLSHIYAREPCNRVAVMGPYAKRIFIQLGYDNEDVVVTGQPRFDALKSPDEPREVVCRKLGVDGSHRILLFAPPVFRSAERRSVFVRALVGATRGIGDLALVVKVHPRGDPAPYRELLRAEGARETSVVTDFPVPSLLHACDLFLSNYSTMALEALLVGRPVIILKTRGESAAYPFDNVAVTVTVDDGEGLTAAIRDSLGSEELQGNLAANRDRFVLEHASGGDGQASQRVAALIRNLCLVQPT